MNEIIWGTINGWQYGRNTDATSGRRGDAFARSLKTGEVVWVPCELGDLMVARDIARERGWEEHALPGGRPVWNRATTR